MADKDLGPWSKPLAFVLLALGILALLAGCGGGSANSSAAGTNASVSTNLPAGSNVLAISVEAGPGNNVNIPYVTVTVCSPGGSVGSSNCKDIEHVLLDTGSTGLRLFASVVGAAPALTLAAQRIGNSSNISECAQFLNAQAWGSIKLADVVLGGERAPSVPVQLMDSSYPTGLNSVCGNSPVMAQTSSTSANLQNLGANGILGLSLFAHDGQHYFNCASPSTNCQIFPTAAQQVQNPVGLFGVSSSNGVANNNGVIVQLPAVSAAGQSSATGALIFGVDTQSNNALGAANVVPVNATSGSFTTTYKGRQLTHSFMDSGSNGLYFYDASLSTSCSTAVSGFYCPPSTQSLTASIQLASTSATVNFSIANADTLFQASNYAFNDLGGTMVSNSFDWGLPFFFGRSVYTVIEGHSVGTTPGPFYAFTN